MAFPAAPTESGGAKLHFLSTDGNAAAGWIAVDTGTSGTGSNTLGFAGVATHVEGDAVGAPGGLATTSVPLVLAGADDGTNAVPLQADASAFLKVVLQAGTAAYGKLAANSGVDIGDVDIISIVPGVAATNLGKAEDAAHSSGDVGVAAMTVRKNTAASLSGSDGDYQPLITDTNGRLHILDANSAAIQAAVELIDDPVAVLGTATYTEAATKGSIVGVVRNDTLATLADTDNEIAPLQVNAGGALYVVLSAGAAVVGEMTIGAATTAASDLAKAEDAAHGSGDVGIQMLAVRKSTPADLSGTDGDYEPLQLDNGRLWVSATIGAALPAGTNAIGKLAANSGVDIGDVDVITMPGTAAEAAALPSVFVVVAGDDGTDTHPLQVDASGFLKAVLQAGTAAFGKLAANSGVDIGDVDVTSVIPGVAATNLGKAEDAAHSSGDVGVMPLAVRNDALAALGGTDGDYAPFQVCEDGGLWTRPSAGPKGGCKMFTSVDLDESEEDPAAGPVTIYGIYAWNKTASPLWLQMFNTNTVTVGTTAPTNNFMIPANADSDGAGVVIPIPVCGLAYSTALTVAITTGSGTDNGAPGAGDAGIAILYQD